MKVKWSRGDTQIRLEDAIVSLPAPLLWLDELADGRLIAVTLFDEDMPPEQTNVFVYDTAGELEKEIRIEENNRPVRFLGSEREEGVLTLLGANQLKYVLDERDWRVTSSHYYR